MAGGRGKVLLAVVREAILEAVPVDGSRIGNQRLISVVIAHLRAAGHEVAEVMVQEAREALIAEGMLGKGRGRGGSVYWIDRANRPGEMTGTALPKPDATVRAKGGDGDEGAGGLGDLAAPGPYDTYRHQDEAPVRPDVGLQAEFGHRRPPRTYR